MESSNNSSYFLLFKPRPYLTGFFQIRKYGKCLDSNPRTQYDKNEIVVYDDYAEIIIYDKGVVISYKGGRKYEV